MPFTPFVWTVPVLFWGSTFVGPVLAQSLPPLYDTAPVELARAESLARFPVNTFLESIAVAADGTLFVTSHEDGTILRLTPAGPPTVWATVDGKVGGVALRPGGSLLVTGWTAAGTPAVFGVSATGTVELLAELPEAAFLNGILPLSDSHYLLADSYRGAIWKFDTTTNTARLWLEHPLLARMSPDSQIPGVNGLKRYNGTLYASNTDRRLLLRIPIATDGTPGEPAIFLDNVNIDDFAFDQDGNLYGATHIYNSVVRIAPNGSITTLAGAEQGMTGSTAVAFGQTPADRTSLYVVTNGGMVLPPPTGVVPAEIVRLEVGKAGAAP